jgi:hypothetical protein
MRPALGDAPCKSLASFLGHAQLLLLLSRQLPLTHGGGRLAIHVAEADIAAEVLPKGRQSLDVLEARRSC